MLLLIRVCEVSLYRCSFTWRSSHIIGSCVRPWGPDTLQLSHGGVLVLATQFAVLQKEQPSVVTSAILVSATLCLAGQGRTSFHCVQYQPREHLSLILASLPMENLLAVHWALNGALHSKSPYEVFKMVLINTFGKNESYCIANRAPAASTTSSTEAR
jgi:hypothetical protein